MSVRQGTLLPHPTGNNQGPDSGLIAFRELGCTIVPRRAVADIQVGVEEHIGGRGVGKDRRPAREVRGGLDHQRAGLQYIVHPHFECAVGQVQAANHRRQDADVFDGGKIRIVNAASRPSLYNHVAAVVNHRGEGYVLAVPRPVVTLDPGLDGGLAVRARREQ